MKEESPQARRQRYAIARAKAKKRSKKTRTQSRKAPDAEHPAPAADQSARPAKVYCEYQACGGMGTRTTRRRWVARRRVTLEGRVWNVCEGCADLIKTRPKTEHLSRAPGGPRVGREAVGHGAPAAEVVPAPGLPRSLQVTKQQRSSIEAWLYEEASRQGVQVEDLRPGGELWLVGGEELKRLIGDCRRNGVLFKFEPEGDRATRGRPGWWTRWPDW